MEIDQIKSDLTEIECLRDALERMDDKGGIAIGSVALRYKDGVHVSGQTITKPALDFIKMVTGRVVEQHVRQTLEDRLAALLELHPNVDRPEAEESAA